MAKREVDLSKLQELIKTLRDVYDEFPPQTVQVFLVIAEEGVITLTDLCEKVGLTIGAVSRNVGRLADKHNGVEGLGFVTVDFVAGSYRQKDARLTPKGERFLAKLMECL